MTKFVCVGGPLDKVVGTQAELVKKLPDLYEKYSSFNCAGRVFRTKLAQKRAERAGEVIVPSAIFVFKDQFRK